jgi:hypothetical protein
MNSPSGLKGRLVKSKQRLIERIERAFAHLPYPGDNRIVAHSYPGLADDNISEEGRIAAVFRGKHWKDLTLGDLARYSATLSFLSPEAYRFYLPAYLLALIRLSPEEMERVPQAGDLEGSLLYSLQPAADTEGLWNFIHQKIDSLTPDQKSAVQAFLHWLYRKRILEHVEYFDYEKSVFAYWGYPAGHPRPSAQELGESLPPMIDGAKRSDSGEWVNDGPNCLLINRLIWDRLIHVDQREGGWPKLYHDPADGSWWELAYPHTEMWGGGAPALTQLPVEQVRARYDLPALSLPGHAPATSGAVSKEAAR